MSSLSQTNPKKRKLPSVPARVLSWVGEESITVTDTRIKPDLDRFARLPPHVLAQLKEVEEDNNVIPGQNFTDLAVADHDDASHYKTTKKGKTISIQLKRDTFRRIAGIRECADDKNSYLIRKVEVRKNPEKSLGFYICKGDGWDRQDGIFVSRLVLGSYMEANDFLRVGDEILKVNEVQVRNFSLSDVALMMQVVEKLVLTIKVLTSVSHMRRHSMRLSISSNALSAKASALSSGQLASSTTESALTSTVPKQQDMPFTNSLAEKTVAKAVEAAEPLVQSDDELQVPISNKKSSRDSTSSLLLSIDQVLEKGYKVFGNSEVTVVDVHNSMAQDGDKNGSQANKMDTSPTAIVTDINKSTTGPSSDSSLMLSISQVLEEGYKVLDDSAVTLVDVHNSMAQDGNIHGSQANKMDISPTGIVTDLNKSTTGPNKKADHMTSPEIRDDDDETSSEGEDSDNVDIGDDCTDFSLFHKDKAKKKIPAPSSDVYKVKKSLWKKQDESIPTHNKIDPIRDMQDTSTSFTGEKINEVNQKTEETEKSHTHTSSTSTDQHDSPYGTTVKVKVKRLSNISSFSPQNLFCCILVDHVKKASTNVKSIQGTTVDFNEDLNINFLPEQLPPELVIAICKPAEEGTDEHVISTEIIKLPDVNRIPDEFLLTLGGIGDLTTEIQVLPLELVLN